MKVALNEMMWSGARELQESIAASGLFKTKNYTGLSIPDRFVYGYVGEFVVEKCLRDNGVKCWHRINATGVSQPSELVAWCLGHSISIEVKTSSKPYYKKLMWPAAQKVDADFVVGVRLNEQESSGQIMGFIPKVMIEDWMEVSQVKAGGIPTRHCDYGKLVPFDWLINQLDKEDRH